MIKNADNTKHNNNSSIYIQNNRIVIFFQKYKIVAILGVLFGTLLYSLMMSRQLTNTFDGLWQQNYHHAGKSELTSGRWMLIFVDKLVMGLHSDPIASIAALILFIIGFLIVLDLFGVENRFCGCLCLMLFISSTAISNTLSYRFTSLGYGLAYLLAVLSVYAVITIKKRPVAIGLAGVLLGLSMSCYQAYLAVFCSVSVFYVIFLYTETGMTKIKNENNIVPILLRLCCSLLIGAVFYIASLSVFLKLYHVSLSGYNGIGEISLGGIIAGLPQSILNTYRFFGAYFFMDKLKINRLQPFGVFYLLLALFIALIILIAIKSWKVKKLRIAFLLLSAAATPIACNAYVLIAGNKLELQMTTGLAMFMPLTIIIAFSYFREKHFLQSICGVLCIALIYGSSMQVWFDQEAMYEGRNACETMATQVISDLKSEDLLSSNYKYFFVGVPAESPYFSVSNIYYSANGYAQVGNFWVSGNCSQMSYKGLINKYMGFNLPIPYLVYENVAARTNVSEMPKFPEEGYITLIDDNIVVIKISEHTEYAGHSKYVID